MSLDFLRNHDVPSYESVDDADPFALIFVVQDDRDEETGEILSTENDILSAAMVGLQKILLSNQEEVQDVVRAWMSGRIRKIAKRARKAAWNKVDILANPHVKVSYGNSTVIVFAPMRVSEQPPALRKLQVSGLQAEYLYPVDNDAPALRVVINPEVVMSTGKLVAQVGHAVQLFMMNANETKVNNWLNSGSVVLVLKDAVNEFDESSVDVAVHDAGFTEVAAGSLTCVASYK